MMPATAAATPAQRRPDATPSPMRSASCHSLCALSSRSKADSRQMIALSGGGFGRSALLYFATLCILAMTRARLVRT